MRTRPLTRHYVFAHRQDTRLTSRSVVFYESMTKRPPACIGSQPARQGAVRLSSARTDGWRLEASPSAQASRSAAIPDAPPFPAADGRGSAWTLGSLLSWPRFLPLAGSADPAYARIGRPALRTEFISVLHRSSDSTACARITPGPKPRRGTMYCWQLPDGGGLAMKKFNRCIGWNSESRVSDLRRCARWRRSS